MGRDWSVRVGIDMLAVRREKTGIGQYAVNIVNEMAARHPEDTFVVFSGGGACASLANIVEARPPRMGTRRPFGRVLWEQLALPWLLREVDVVFCPTNVLPLFLRKPAVLTVHDLTFMGYPRKFPLLNRLYYHVMYRLSVRLARAIITVSHHAKTDLVNRLRVPPRKVRVVYPGVSARFYQEYEPETVRLVLQKHGISTPYLLFVGTLDPGKNAARLIEAFAKVASEVDGRYNLVVAGQQGRHYRAAVDAVKKHGLEDKVRFTGFVPDDELPCLYRAATAFVFPSLYEGFGLPIIEAMACGTPVAVSNSSCLREVAGDAALLFDPLDVADMSACLRRILEDEVLRGELAARGRERALGFSWGAAAEEIYRLLAEVVLGYARLW